MTGQSTAASITAGRPAVTAALTGLPERARLQHRGRPLKRWRYVGVFCEQLMACAAQVQIGAARQTFWALHTPGSGAVRERTRRLPRAGEVQLIADANPGVGSPGGLMVIRAPGLFLDLTLSEGPGITARCPDGRSEVWTRKQAGVQVRGTLTLDGGEPHTVEARGVIDDTAGYHARVTEWHWSAGVGEGADGSALAWNLVSGINDPPTGSERAVWVNGLAHEVAPVGFAPDLSAVTAADGGVLSFDASAERTRRDNLVLLSSDYRAPFGSFSGSLPGGIALAHGLGVMEHHRARW